MGTTRVKFEAEKRSPAEVRSTDEAKAARDKTEALRLYGKQPGESPEMQNDIAEIKLRTQRRASELLRTRLKNPRSRPAESR